MQRVAMNGAVPAWVTVTREELAHLFAGCLWLGGWLWLGHQGLQLWPLWAGGLGLLVLWLLALAAVRAAGWPRALAPRGLRVALLLMGAAAALSTGIAAWHPAWAGPAWALAALAWAVLQALASCCVQALRLSPRRHVHAPRGAFVAGAVTAAGWWALGQTGGGLTTALIAALIPALGLSGIGLGLALLLPTGALAEGQSTVLAVGQSTVLAVGQATAPAVGQARQPALGRQADHPVFAGDPGLFDCLLPPPAATRASDPAPHHVTFRAAGLGMLPMMASLPWMPAWCAASGLSPTVLLVLHLAAMLLPAALLARWLRVMPAPRLAAVVALVLLAGAAWPWLSPGWAGLMTGQVLQTLAWSLAWAHRAPPPGHAAASAASAAARTATRTATRTAAHMAARTAPNVPDQPPPEPGADALRRATGQTVLAALLLLLLGSGLTWFGPDLLMPVHAALAVVALAGLWPAGCRPVGLWPAGCRSGPPAPPAQARSAAAHTRAAQTGAP